MKRVIYFDILNIFACFAVLALHHNGIVHWYKVDTLAWKQALAFEVLFYWAVPVFFMLTGATLLGYREKYSTKDFFLKRATRVVIPFIAWSIILLVYHWAMGDFPYHNMKEVINAIIQTKIKFGDIYWFFIPLIALYCIIPILSLLKSNYTILFYIVISIFVTTSCFPLLFNLLGLKYNYALAFPMAGYVIFIVLGYLLSILELSRNQRYILYLLALVSITIRYFGTYYFSLSSGKIDKVFFGYTHFHSVFLAIAVFVFIKQINWHQILSEKTKCFISTLSAYSFGIYLIHKLVMNYELKLLGIGSDNVYWRFLGMFMTYLICVVLIMFIKKLPIIGKYIV